MMEKFVVFFLCFHYARSGYPVNKTTEEKYRQYNCDICSGRFQKYFYNYSGSGKWNINWFTSITSANL